MQIENKQVSTQENYVPHLFQRFLWWLSTADAAILMHCKIDRSKYAIVGMSVLGTWIFATLAWMYFFSTVVNNIFSVVFLGLIMGAIILSIDRLLIKGMNTFNKKQLFPFLLRAALAITIGTFMAQPALLYLFDKEVHVQISIDNEQRKKEKKQQQDTVFSQQKKELLLNKKNIQTLLQQRYQEVATARNNFIAETDGSGGSKKVGLQAIAKAKQQEYEKLNTAYNELLIDKNKQQKSIDSTLAFIDATIAVEQQNFNALLNDGFLTRIEALNHLVENNTALKFRYYLLVAILLLIELMPVIAKILLPTGTYDEKVAAIEAMEKQMLTINMQNELSLKKLYSQLAFDNDTSSVTSFFKNSKNIISKKVDLHMEEWNENSQQTFNGVWKNVQKDVLSKPEN